MAVLDADAGEIVIRVVYDGPPEAGKTTSLRALAGSLSQLAVTPEEDGGGRTAWFDWMEYTGGRFEGCRIRCQIVSVPGQPALAGRRRALLDGADVVVCVADSSPAGWEASTAHLFGLRRELADGRDPPLGVVLQANKRDVPGAAGLDELRARLGREAWNIGVVESVAADGTGIREAFVYAVRLALDRVRELMTRRTLRTGRPELGSADELLALMRDRERPPVIESAPDSVAAALLREVLAAEHGEQRAPSPLPPAPHAAPLAPDAGVPSGAIWPPVEGRAILNEVAQHPLVPRRLSSGDWAAGLGSGWRVVSSKDAAYPGLDQGRAALLQWARLHALSLPVISPRRCVVLADAGDGTWRLWQIVRAEESLRELVSQALLEPSEAQVGARLRQAAQLLLDADRRLAQAPCALSCNLDSVGVVDGLGVYVGLMPDLAHVHEPDPAARASPQVLLRTQLAPLIQDLPGHAELLTGG